MKRSIGAWAKPALSAGLVMVLSGCLDGGGGSSPPDNNPPPVVNTPPVANAGPDQVVAPGSPVSLNGGGSADANGSIATYAWTQTAGASVALDSAGAAAPSFTAPSTAGALTFRLTVTDNGGASHSDTVTVTINAIPVANAGADQTVSAGAAVSLNGSASDGDGSIASYAWVQTSGAAVTVNNAGGATATFIAPNAAATLAFTLTATDDRGATHADSVTITVSAPGDPTPSAPAIGRQPNNARSREYGSAMLFVAAAGTDLSYEWRNSNGIVVKTGTEPFLLRTGLEMSDNGNCYYVVIGNSLGTVTSNQGCITVDEIEWDFDPSDDPSSADDAAYAMNYGETLLRIVQTITGPLTQHTGGAMPLGFPLEYGPARNCHMGQYHGATLDGVPISNSIERPLGRHSISESWNQCYANSDDLRPRNGAYLLEYDFPQTWGVGSITMHVSDRHFNGTLSATLVANDDNGQRSDDIDILIGDNFSSGELKASSPQAIPLEREYSSDGQAVEEVLVDLGVQLAAFDVNGADGTLFTRQGGVFRLRQDFTQGGFSSDGVMVVGHSAYVLAALQPNGEVLGWNFEPLMLEDCPPGYVCVDPLTP